MSGAKVATKPGMNRSSARYNSPTNSSQIGQTSSAKSDLLDGIAKGIAPLNVEIGEAALLALSR